MSDVILVVILLAAFGLAIGLVRLLDRLITRDAPVDDLDAEPPGNASAATAATDLGRSR
jgi:hypothetical protein